MEKNNDVCGVGVAYRARITGECVCVGVGVNADSTVYIVRHCKARPRHCSIVHN